MGIKKTEEIRELSFDNAIDLKRYMVNLLKTRKQNSYFFVCTANGDGTNFTQKSFHKSELNEALEYIHNNLNKRIFVPTVLFENRERVEETVGQIRKILIDLDLYKSEKHKDKKPEDVLKDIEKNFFQNKKIPFANAITYSGGGLYLEWNLKFTPGGNVLQKRRVVMKILFEMLKEYAPDAKSLDAPHVFSLPETINWKYDKDAVVKTYENGLPDYTLSELARELPNLWEVWKVTRKIKTKKEKKRNFSAKKRTSIIPIHNERTLAHDHIVTIQQLIQLREGEMYGYREMALFFVRNAYHKMHSKRFYEKDETLFEESFQLALEVNQMFTEPLSEEEIRKSTFNDKKLYRFKTETINDWFDIELDEQIQIKVKTPEAKKEKSKRQMRELKEIKEENTHDYKRKKIEQYFAENPTASLRQASKDLNIHRETIKKYHPNF